MRLLVNTDGTAICYGSRYDTLKFYYLQELGEQLKTPTLTVVDEILNISPIENATSYEVYSDATLLTTIDTLSVDLSQYINEKNTYLMVRALADGHESSDFACVKYGVDLIPGTYTTGAIDLYKTQGAAAVEDMLINPWGELVINQVVTQNDTTVSRVGSTINCDLILPQNIKTLG